MIKFKFVVITLIIFGLCSCKNETKQQKVNSNTITLNDENSKDDSQKEGNSTISNVIVKDCNQTFEEFFEHFSRDSTFQKSRVKYPLKFLYNDYEIDSIIVVKKIMSKNDYKYLDFTDDKNAMNKESEKYTVDIEKLDSIIKYRHLGYDNGIMDTFTFKQIDGCWYMVEILDEST